MAITIATSHSQAVENSTPKIRALFSKPTLTQKDFSIRNEVIRMIQNTPRGETIRTTFYDSNAMDVAQALATASLGGVFVRVVLDDSWSDDDKNIDFANAIAAGGVNTNVVKCIHGGCMAWSGNNHNKFFTFSATTDPSGNIVRNVSVVTSANMNKGVMTKYQDMLVFENDSSLFNHYNNYWNALAGQQQNYTYMDQPNGITLSNILPVKAFSGATNRGDFQLADLQKVTRCISGESRIDLSFSETSVERITPYVTKLVELKSKGCEVHLIVNDEDTKVIQYIKSNQLDLTVLQESLDEDPMLHSKVMLINAYSDNGSGGFINDKYVFMGSRLLTMNSLDGKDETTVRVRSAELYNQYLQYVEHIRMNASPNAITDLYVTYPISTFTFIVGNTVNLAAPVISSGGTISSCSISAQLPAGLIFNTSTCKITGTATAASSKKNYTITARSSYTNYDSGNAVISIEVKPKITISP